MLATRPDARRLSSLVLSTALSLLATAPASAAVLGSAIASARTQASMLAASPAWRPAQEEQLLDVLDAAVTTLRERGGSAREAAALRELVSGTHARHDGWSREHERAIIAADGDLEALQETEEWQTREEIALQLLYLRNWLYLESATRFDPRNSHRAEWLRRASEGFGQLAGAGDPLIAAESYFGRALCARALEKPADAIADLRRAAALDPPVELAQRIDLALVEAQIDAGQIGEALTSSGELLKSMPTPEAEFLRAKVVLLALVSVDLNAERRRALRRQAAELVSRLERRGGDWPRLARQLVAAGVTRPEEWVADNGSATIRWIVAEALRAKGKCAEALALYQALAAAQPTPGNDLLLAQAECYYREGEYEAASVVLGRVPPEADVVDRGDAAFMRFKVAEARDRKEASAESAAALHAAAETLLADFPDHAQAFEARFRLGESERRKGNLLAAAAHFDAVTGDEQLALQATFQSAECYVEAWEELSRTGDDRADPLAEGALVRLRRFLDSARAYREKHGQRPGDEVNLAPLEARARVLGALLLVRRETADDAAQALEWLDGFETRFPQATELQAQASAVRAVAMLDLGRYADARRAIEHFLAAPVPSARDYVLMKRLAVRTLQLGGEPRLADNPAAVASLEASALALYESLLQAVRDGKLRGESPTGLEELVERLRRQAPPT